MAGERLHEGVTAWLEPRLRGRRVLEVGAGDGRLTLPLAAVAESVLALEPAAPLRALLRRRLHAAGARRVEVRRGFFQDLPTTLRFDAVVTCSALDPPAMRDPDAALAAMEASCAGGGLVVVVWPPDLTWLRRHGYEHVTFAGPVTVEFASPREALRMVRIFYPHAVAEVAARRSRVLDTAILGINAPRDLCWKTVAA